MPPPQDRATAWSVTINNPVKNDEENIALARQRGWRVIGQLEKGAEGTPHYQLMVKTPQVRFSAVKKQFPRAHIEVCRNTGALEQYVQKEDTREGELNVSQDAYPSLQRLWDLFTEYIENRDELMAKETWKPEKWLLRFDQFIEHSIENGLVVETLGVNPQIRSSVKKYGRSIVIRSITRRQTDRQTSQDSVSVNENGNEESTNSEASGEEADEALCEEETDVSSPSFTVHRYQHSKRS